ncbi:GPW/gp25 family protein [Apibacter raozihei]|uniref:GPW/gp25 family protein n=1 Tax=Apibacter TaxID=1778601 RepID=UPI000FE429ED|nr:MULTISPECIES: GPW/gp25 family protein [Apibacter]
MYGIYYNTPINFKDIIEKKDIEKTNLESSIARYINLLVTSSFGECKFDETYGCKIWEMDFDLLSDSNTLRDRIKKDIKETIKMHESRLELSEVEISVGIDQSLNHNNALRMKKKISMKILGAVKKTNRPFRFHGHFFVGPLSYI